MHMVILLTAMGTNFARSLNSFATASSLLSRGHPKHAIDGNPAASFSQGSCTLTDREYEPWWRLYFGQMISGSEVVITNRADCCGKMIYYIVAVVLCPSVTLINHKCTCHSTAAPLMCYL